VNEVVVTLRVELPDTPGLRVTEAGFNVPAIEDVVGLMLEESEMVPEKPLLFRVI
jgi:hypothetical protein